MIKCTTGSEVIVDKDFAFSELRVKINQLRANIYGALVPLITSDYVLLDCPYHSNIGDILIWRGEQSFLDKLPHRCLGQSSKITFRDNMKIRSSDTILLHGGGNFGDLWREHQDFRLKIIARYPKNRIVILPQTVYYKDADLMARDAEAFALHPDLTICVRDSASYHTIKENFRNNVLLVPDMAFYIDTEEFDRWLLPKIDQNVYVRRLDKELAENGSEEVMCPPGIQVRDWPTFEHRDWRTMLLLGILRILSTARKFRFVSWFANTLAIIADRFAREGYVRFMVKTGVKFLSPYNKVYTTRLHVGILAILLHKECHFIDNSYGKNSSFFKTWLAGVDKITMDTKNK